MSLTYYHLLVVVVRLFSIAKLRQSKWKSCRFPLTVYETGFQRVDAEKEHFAHHNMIGVLACA